MGTDCCRGKGSGLGRSEIDPRTRHSIYREFEATVADRMMLLPLFHEQSYRFLRPEWKGLMLRLSMPQVAYERLELR